MNALENLKEELNQLQANSSFSKKDIAAKLFEIGQENYKLSKFNESLYYFKQCLDIRKEIDPPDKIDIALTLDELGIIKYKMYNYIEALNYLNESLELKKQTLEANDSRIGKTLNRIGFIYRSQKKYDEALSYLIQANEIFRNASPTDNPMLAVSYSQIGIVYNYKQNKEDAMRYFNLSLDIFNQMSETHGEKAGTLGSIADMYHEQHKYEESIGYYTESIEILKKHYSPKNLDLAKALSSLGSVYYDLGKYDEALRCYNDALDIRKQIFPSTNNMLKSNLNKIGATYQKLGNYEEALKYLTDENEKEKCRKELREQEISESRRKMEVEEDQLKESLNSVKLREDSNNISSSSSKSSRVKSDIIDPENDPLIGVVFKDRYTVKKILGKGSFGRVCLVFDDTDQIDKAVKIMDKFDSNTDGGDTSMRMYSPELSETAQNELLLMKNIKHENIVQYFDDFEVLLFGTEYLCIISEFCQNLDLKKRIKEAKDLNKKFSEVTILDWALQATNGLKYLHSKKIIHRDIKPANIFLDQNDVIKLGDLGLSKLVDSTKARSFAGAPLYMSPEQFRCLYENCQYTFTSDIWSLGCVVFELLFLKVAFPEGQKNNPPLPDFGNSLFSRVLERMFENDPEKRIDSTGLYERLLKIKGALE